MTYDELCKEYAKTDSFMEPQVSLEDDWMVFDSEDEGIIYINYEDILLRDGPCSDRKYDLPGCKCIMQRIVGYGARLSAPGYLDCTDWCVFDTEQEAIDYLAETYLEY